MTLTTWDLLPSLWTEPILVGIAALLSALIIRYLRKPSVQPAQVAAGNKTADETQYTKDGYPIIVPQGRTAGKWEADKDFKYPPVAPAAYEVLDKLPPKYRPFRFGQVFQTMGLHSMDWQEWIQLDRDFPKWMKARQDRLTEKASETCYTLPGAEDAAKECALELSSYLAKRYPNLYKVYPTGSEHSQGGIEIQEVECLYRKQKWRLNRSPGGDEVCNDPMAVVGLLIQDDAFLMVEQEDGHHCLMGGAALTPGFWRMKDKLGMRLRDLHLSSDVPHFKEKLQNPMERFFSKLAVDKPVQRNNYFFQLDDVLPWNKKMMGEERYFVHKIHAPDPEAVAAGKTEYHPPQPIKRANELWLRSERQTLRRMPRTGVILFTVRTYLTNLDDLITEPRVPGRLASAIRGMDPTIAGYKGVVLYKDAVLPVLDAAHEQQIKDGIIDKDDQAQSYPY